MMARRLISVLRTGILVLALVVGAHSANLLPNEPAPPARDTAPAVTSETNQPQETRGRLPLEELRVFTEVMHRIKTTYVEEIDDKTLLDYAIKGMVARLDPHSAYLEPDDFKHLEESTSGEFGGLGMEVTHEDGLIRVVTPIDDTPAERAGIEAGDLIIKLDGKSVRGMSLTDAVAQMRGEPGKAIKLTIIREGNDKPVELILVRDIIKVPSVRQRMLEPGYGYIRLSQFQVDSGKEVLNAIDQLKKEQNKQPLKGLVLDLRNNPGGVLHAAVEVVDAFLSDGLIVYTKGRMSDAGMSYSANQDDPSNGIPLVVLINSGSASASEIVAGALQDHHRAVLLGTRSFGKGSVQTVLPLSTDEKRGLKLTTALYYTPSGRSIQAEGIKPDIQVDMARVTRNSKENSDYREVDLQGHLENGNGRKDSQTAGKQVSAKSGKLLDERDYQLSQALNILKGMHIAGWIKSGTNGKNGLSGHSDRVDVKDARKRSAPHKQGNS